MKYILNSYCKNFAVMRNEIVKFLLILVASFSATNALSVPKAIQTKHLTFNNKYQSLVAMETGYEVRVKGDESWMSTTSPTRKHAGTYTIEYREINKEAETYKSFTCTIDPYLLMPLVDGETRTNPYTGGPISPKIKVDNPYDFLDVKVVFLEEDGYSSSATEYGTYYVKFGLVGDDAKDFQILDLYLADSWSIVKPITVIWSDLELTYNGEYQFPKVEIDESQLLPDHKDVIISNSSSALVSGEINVGTTKKMVNLFGDDSKYYIVTNDVVDFTITPKYVIGQGLSSEWTRYNGEKKCPPLRSYGPTTVAYDKIKWTMTDEKGNVYDEDNCPILPGNYVINRYVEGDTKGNYAFAELKFEIKKVEVSVKNSPTIAEPSKEYYGKEYYPCIPGGNEEIPGEWRYYTFLQSKSPSYDEIHNINNYSKTLTKVSGVGEYLTSYVFVPEDLELYAIYFPQGSISFEIMQLENVPSDYTVPKVKKDLVYNGSYQELLIAGKEGSVAGKWMYSSDGGKTYSDKIPTGKAVDTYKNITFKFVPTDSKYCEVPFSNYEATIKKGTPQIISMPVPSASVNTTGSVIALAGNHETQVINGHFVFSLDGVNFSTAWPSVTTVGTHYIYLKVIGYANYEDIEDIEPLKVEVDQLGYQSPELEVVEGITYDGLSHTLCKVKKDAYIENSNPEIVVKGSYSWQYKTGVKDGEDVYSEEIPGLPSYKNVCSFSLQDVKIKFTPDEDYYVIENNIYFNGNLEITPKEVRIDWEDEYNGNLPYTGDAQSPMPSVKATDICTVDKGKVSAVLTSKKQSEIGEGYIATAKLSGDEEVLKNYKLSSEYKPYKFNIVESTIEFNKPKANIDLVYSGEPQSLLKNFGSASTVPGTVYYAYGTETKAPAESAYKTKEDFDDKQTDGGTYYIYYKFVPTNTKLEPTEPVSLSIKIRQYKLTTKWLVVEDHEYDGTRHRPTATFTGFLGDDNFNATVSYRNNDEGTGLCDGKSVGIQKVRADVPNDYDNNYTVVDEHRDSVYKITPKEVTVKFYPVIFEYDGKEHLPDAVITSGKIGNDDVKAVNEGDPKTEPNKGTKYFVTAKLQGEASGNYVIASGTSSASFAITEGSTHEFTAPTALDRVADGTEKPLVKAGVESQNCPGSFVYALGTSESAPAASSYKTAIPEASETGTYYVYYKYIPSGQYPNFAESLPKYVEVTISAKIPGMTLSLNIADWTYGDEPNDPVLTGNDCGKEIYTYYFDEHLRDEDKTDSEWGWSDEEGGVPREVGTYYVKVDVEPTASCEGGSAKSVFEIKPRKITVEWDEESLTKVYDGNPISPKYTIYNDIKEDNLEFAFGYSGWDPVNVTSESSTPAKLWGKTSHCYYLNVYNQETIEFTIKKAPLKVTLNPKTSVYTGTSLAKTPNVIIEGLAKKDEGLITATAVLADDDNDIEVGTHTYKIVYKAESGALLTNYELQEEALYEITKVSVGDYKEPVGYDTLVYTGSGQELVSKGVSGEVPGKFMFAFDKESEFSEVVPTKTNADTYTVWYKFVPNDLVNYAPSEPKYIEVRIKPVERDLKWDKTTLKYNAQPQAPSAELLDLIGDDVVAVEVSGAETNVGSDYLAIATLSGVDAKNYLISSKSSKTTKFDIVVSDYSDFKAPTFKDDLTYDGDDHELLATYGTQGKIAGKFLYSIDKSELSENIPSKKVAGSYTVGYKFIPEDNGYLPSDTIYSIVKISQKTITLDWGTLEFVYDETPKKPIPDLKGVVKGDDVTVTVTGEKTEVGNNYEAIAKLGGEDLANYTISSANLTAEFSIVSNTAVKPVITQKEYTYDGTTFEFVPVSKEYTVVGFASAKEPGKYPVKIELKPGYKWSDGSTDAIDVDFVINKKIVPIPAKDSTKFVFNGKVQSYELKTNSAYTISGNKQRAAGAHSVVVSLLDKNHYEWSDGSVDDREYIFTISKAMVKLPVVVDTLSYVYDGVEKEFGITAYEGSILDEANSVGTDAGTYVRTVSLDMDEDGGYVWSDNTTEPKVFKFEIEPQPVIIPTNFERYFIYTGKTHYFEIPEDTAAVKRYTIEMEETSAVGPGTFIANLVLISKKNYIWADNTVKDREVEFVISDGRISQPVIEQKYVYTGSEIVFASSTSAYTVEGGSGINVGTYKVVVTPKENYSWLDGSNDPIERNVKIVEKPIEKPVISKSPVTYNGEELFRVPESKYYKISGDTFGVEPGSYKAVLSLLDNINYMWSDSTKADLNFTFEIEKIKIPVPVSDKTLFTYDGKEKTYNIDVDPACKITGNKHTDAGLYSVKVSIESPYHMWDDNTVEPKSYRFLISPAEVIDPIVPKNSLEYDGTAQDLEILPSDKYVVGKENATATNVGVYERTVSLVDVQNYVWKSGGTADKVISFNITPKPVVVPTVVRKHDYTGKPIEFVAENPAYTVKNRVQTNAGSYEVVISLNSNYIWKDNTSDDKIIPVEIVSMVVAKPDVQELTFEYDGKTHSFGFTPNVGYSFVGDTAAKEPGVYVVTVKLNENYMWNDDTNGDIDFTFVISKIDVSIPVANTTKFTYNGNKQTYNLIIPEDSLFTVSDNVQTGAGSYVVKVSLKDPDHYQWSDSTSADKFYDFIINKGKVALPTAPITNLIYDGEPKELKVNPSELYVVADSNSVATKTGRYIRTATLVDSINYTWVDETTGVQSITFIIGDGTLEIPKVDSVYTYTGDTIIFVPKDGAYSVINGAKREVGKYKVVVIPNEGYRWSNGSQEPIVYNVVIKPIVIDIPKLQLEYTYNGKIIDFKVPVNAAYEINGETFAKEIGKYKVTLELLPNYMWNDSTLEDVSYIFSINKKIIPIPSVDTTVFVYNGKRQTYSIAKSADYNVLGNVQAYAGTYEVSVFLTDFVHSMWSDSTVEVKSYIFNIARAKIELPTAVQESFTYDGTVKYFAVSEDSRYEVLSKNASASKVGVYDRVVTLKDTLNYTWIDGSVTDKTVTFTIGTGVIDYPTVVLDTVYTGSPITLVPENNAYTVENGTKTDAGTYDVVVKLKDGYIWSDKTNKDTIYTVVIRPLSIVKPKFPTTDTYTYNDSIRGVDIPESNGYTVTGVTQSKEPGRYAVTVALNPNYIWSDNTVDPLIYIYTINRIVVEIPAKCDSVFKFTGSEITYPIPDTLSYYVVTGHHRTSAGLHTVTVTLTDTLHYVWSDNTSDPKYYEFLIDKYKIELPLAKIDSFTYDGGVKLFDIIPNDNYIIERNNASAIDTGVYYRSVSLIDTVNFLWSDGTIEDKKVAFYILSGVIPSIYIPTDLVYTGDTIILIEENPVYSVSHNRVVNAGTYEVVVTPNSGYTWASDNSKTGKGFIVVVAPKMVPIPVSNSGTFLYNGKEQTYNIVIPEDSLFSVSGNVQSEVGVYEVLASLKDTKNYCWTDSTVTPKSYEFVIENSSFEVDTIGQSNDLVLEATPGHVAVLDVRVQGSVYKYWITCDSCPDLNVDTTLISSSSLSSIDMYLPDTIKPGVYKLKISFMSGTLVKTQEVDLKVNYPATNIYLIWNDVLTVDNSEGLFESYQWYKNGQPIEGATHQYYQENEGLDGYYMCLVNDELFVGPLFFHIDKPLWIKAYGGLSTINVEVIGDIPAGTKVGVYSISGYEVDVKEAERFVQFESVPNTYIVKLIGPDPAVKFTNQSVKVLVK